MSFDQLAAELEQRRAEHLYRQRVVLQSPQQPEVIIDGKPYLAFSSNDYLGLANHPDVIAAFQKAANEAGVGGGASHLVNGHSHYHHALEEALAEFTGRSKALLFSSGFMANQGAITALMGKEDLILQDRLNHASLLDAGVLSGARSQRYLHNDAESLAARFERFSAKARRTLVVTDGVFSMDGDIADLPALMSCAKAQGAWTLVDDAHGIGVLGNEGRGTLDHFGLNETDVPVLMGTLGKAFGTYGAFVAGSEVLIETLIQHARSYIYTTSMPPAVAAASLASLKRIKADQWRRDHLASLIKQLRTGCEQLGFEMMPSSTPIQPILVGSADRALQLSEQLKAKGIWITAIRPPTVPAGSARLRITLSAAHTEQQVDRLLVALSEVVSSKVATQ
jgi:8-amino-7-oxononanoate synthase